jgi:hypothetical protein
MPTLKVTMIIPAHLLVLQQVRTVDLASSARWSARRRRSAVAPQLKAMAC